MQAISPQLRKPLWGWARRGGEGLSKPWLMWVFLCLAWTDCLPHASCSATNPSGSYRRGLAGLSMLISVRPRGLHICSTLILNCVCVCVCVRHVCVCTHAQTHISVRSCVSAVCMCTCEGKRRTLGIASGLPLFRRQSVMSLCMSGQYVNPDILDSSVWTLLSLPPIYAPQECWDCMPVSPWLPVTSGDQN